MRAILPILLTCLPAVAAAQHPVGRQFQVNTYTTGTQFGRAIGPDGASGFVVAWRSDGSSGTDTSEESIQAQRYNGDGSPVGGEFQVNTYTTGRQLGPAVGPHGAGGFVVAWASLGSSGTDSDSWSVQAQRYAADGTTAGDQFQVNAYTTDHQANATIAPVGSGGFVIAWDSDGSRGTDTSQRSVQARRYAADGSPLGDEFQVNQYSIGEQYIAAVGANGAGGFVVTWSSALSKGPDEFYSVWARRYDADGSPIGDEFQVNTTTLGGQFISAVASDGAGGFVVTWESQISAGSDSDGFSIQAQRYDADGSPAGGEFQVNTYTTGRQNGAQVAVSGTGGFVITWASVGSSGTDSSLDSIQAQAYAGDGTPIGSEFQVNSYTTSCQFFPGVGQDGAGGFIITWSSCESSDTDSDGSSIQAQRYAGIEIFADGFESGDTSAWSTAIP